MTPTAKLIQTIETAQTPYTVTFSPNAQLLAYGDGFFYGGGRVVCLKPGAGVVAELVWADVLPDEMKFVTTSGLCFDGSNDFIAVAAWRDRHGYYPAVVCRAYFSSDRLRMPLVRRKGLIHAQCDDETGQQRHPADGSNRERQSERIRQHASRKASDGVSAVAPKPVHPDG